MEKIPETPLLPAKLGAPPIPREELPDEFEKLLEEVAPATKLEERMQNWGSD